MTNTPSLKLLASFSVRLRHTITSSTFSSFSQPEKSFFFFLNFLRAKQSLRLKLGSASLRLLIQLCYYLSNPQQHQIRKSQCKNLSQGGKHGSHLQPLHHQQIRRPHILQGTSFLMDLFLKFISIINSWFLKFSRTWIGVKMSGLRIRRTDGHERQLETGQSMALNARHLSAAIPGHGMRRDRTARSWYFRSPLLPVSYWYNNLVPIWFDISVLFYWIFNCSGNWDCVVLVMCLFDGGVGEVRR